MEDLLHQLTQPFVAISDDIAFNLSFVIQLAIFLALYFILRPLLWEPFLALADRRRALTTGNRAQAEAEEAEVLRLEAEYAEKIKAARQAAQEERAKIRAQAQESARSMIEAAKKEAGAIGSQVRIEVAEATAKARTQLGAEAEEIARLMTAKVLGHPV